MTTSQSPSSFGQWHKSSAARLSHYLSLTLLGLLLTACRATSRTVTTTTAYTTQDTTLTTITTNALKALRITLADTIYHGHYSQGVSPVPRVGDTPAAITAPVLPYSIRRLTITATATTQDTTATTAATTAAATSHTTTHTAATTAPDTQITLPVTARLILYLLVAFPLCILIMFLVIISFRIMLKR